MNHLLDESSTAVHQDSRGLEVPLFIHYDTIEYLPQGRHQQTVPMEIGLGISSVDGLSAKEYSSKLPKMPLDAT